MGAEFPVQVERRQRTNSANGIHDIKIKTKIDISNQTEVTPQNYIGAAASARWESQCEGETNQEAAVTQQRRMLGLGGDNLHPPMTGVVIKIRHVSVYAVSACAASSVPP